MRPSELLRNAKAAEQFAALPAHPFALMAGAKNKALAVAAAQGFSRDHIKKESK